MSIAPALGFEPCLYIQGACLRKLTDFFVVE
jgi:hypothetical protein